jgi:hypothetical protein
MESSKSKKDKQEDSQEKQLPEKEYKDSPQCGLVMPISAIDECNEQHWLDVKNILEDVIKSAGFLPNLVSDSDDVGIIQRRIVTNLYENPIVVCDVSCKNPNVMFELGLRLAFDKATIIVKDDKTSYSFDTAPIEHLTYPRDLRFNKIITFKESLTQKLIATHKRASSDSDYSTFLKHFGQYKVSKLDTSHISKDDYIIEEIRSLRRAVNHLSNESKYKSTLYDDISRLKADYTLSTSVYSKIKELYKELGEPAIDESVLQKLKNTLEDFYPNHHWTKKAIEEFVRVSLVRG